MNTQIKIGIVGATTMIFSILFTITDGLKHSIELLSLVNAPFFKP